MALDFVQAFLDIRVRSHLIVDVTRLGSLGRQEFVVVIKSFNCILLVLKGMGKE